MRKLKLLMATLAMIVGGVNCAWAYTVNDLTSAGWTQVTDLSSLNLADNYFIFIDANASSHAVTNGAPLTTQNPVYYSLVNPFAVAGEVWMISESNGNYTLQGIEDNYYFNSGSAGWNDLMTEAKENAEFSFAFADGKWSIKSITTNAWCGPWNNDGSVKLTDGIEGVAANKSESQAPGFYLYAIARNVYNAARRNAAALASEGWTLVTETNGLGLAGYYYAILDVSESGVESGYVLTGTGGRPTYTPLTNPIDNKAQLWTLEAHGSGYAFKDMAYNKYMYSAASWNMQATDNINTANSDYIPTYINNGIWTLSNSISTGEFVGTYSNTKYQPFENEGTASNKVAGEGKRQFMFYSIPTIAGVATELPASGDMAADTWYYIDINAAANNYEATATTLTNIVYTTDGSILVKNGSNVTDQFTATDNSLSATRYYVKSSSNNNLEIGVSSYTYTVGAATPSIADGAYTASLATFEFTFSDASSNDPGATFSLLNGSAKAVLTKGGTSVAEGTLSLSGKVLTATFSGVTLDLSSTYVIAIAADVVGFTGQATNTAISTTFKTGTIAEGVYYFKKNGENKYLGRGGSYGTEAVATDLGISFELILQSDGKYYLKNHDHSLAAKAGKYLGLVNGSYYTDATTAQAFIVEAATDGYYLRPDDSNYFKTTEYSTDLDVPYNYLSVTATESEAIVWEPTSKETYNANITALRDAEAATVATKAGISAATLAALKSAIASDYVSTDVTSSVLNAECVANLDSWSQVKYASNGQNNFDADGTCGEVWAGLGGIKQTVAGLAPGLYKVSVHATWRPGGKESGIAAGNEINTNAWVYANTATSANLTQLKSWYAGGATIDNRTDMKGSGDTYLNDVYVYVSDGESLTIGLASPTQCNGAWLPFFGWTLTRYEAKATEEEKQALAEAISNHVIGFEKDEYAPYNNIGLEGVLANANGIDPDNVSGAEVVAATNALTAATWTANAAEVNAIYDGTFANAENNGAPAGWVTDHTAGLGGEYHARAFVDDSRLSVFGNETNSAFYQRWDDTNSTFNTVYTYGATDGYTMPLKAAVYRMKGQLGVWSNDVAQKGRNIKVYITDAEGNEIAAQTVTESSGTPVSSENENGEIVEFNFLVPVTAVGNYKFNITNVSNGSTAVVLSNLELKKAVAENITINETDTYVPAEKFANVTFNRTLVEGWNGLVLPFDMTVNEAKATFNASSVKDFGSVTSGENGAVLNFVDATEIKAGRPFMLKAVAGTSYTINNVLLTDDALQTVQKASDGNAAVYTFTGTYAGTTNLNDVTFFLINGTKYYYHTAGVNPSSAKAFRAYFVNETPTAQNSRVSFNFGDDTTTGIEALSTKALGGEVYNLNGQKVEKAQKGLYIVNGKKVVIK